MTGSILKRSGEALSGCILRHLTTFRSKAIAFAIPGIVFSSIVYTAGSVMTQQETLREEILERAGVISTMASLYAVPPLLSKDPDHLQAVVRSLSNVPEVLSVCLYDRERGLMTDDGSSPGDIHPRPGHAAMTLIENNDHYDIYAPVFLDMRRSEGVISPPMGGPADNKDLIGWVRIGLSKTHMKKARAQIIFRGTLTAVFFTIGSSIIVYILFSYATRPLTELSNAVKSIRDGHYPEIVVSSRDEVSDLASEFNRMSRAISKREEMLMSRARLSEFSAEVAIALTESAYFSVMLHTCAGLFQRYTDSVCVMLWLCDSDRTTLRLRATAGTSEGAAFFTDTVHVDDESPRLIAQKRLPFSSTNAADNLAGINGDFLMRNDIRCYTCYPMIVESRLIGVIELLAGQPFSRDLLNTIDTLSGQMAVGFERKLIEEQMHASLTEKEVLLREIHHRVKNNMQVISSLLNLQSETISDQGSREVFGESRNRIRAMALIHEKLYQTRDIAHIDIGDYIASLAHGLFMFYGVDSSRIVLRIDAAGIVLGIDTAIPCGLIINELLSNALKYAFPAERAGIIGITMKKYQPAGDRGAVYILKVRDNGAGMPAGFDFRSTKSLGLHLVMSLAEHQLQGSMKVKQARGTVFLIRFRDARYRNRV